MNINEIKRLLNKKIAIKITYCNDDKAISRYVETISRKDFLESFKEKILTYEICYQEPERFKLGTLYIRADKKMVYLYGIADDSCANEQE